MTQEHALAGRAAAPPLWLLVLITGSGTLGMHIFVPALAVAGRDLGAGPATIQLTVTVYMIGLAIGQLVYGPLSDSLGRRPVLVGALSLYAAACLAALVAPTVELLILARLLQALGACAGLVLGRAMVRDTANPDETAAKLASLNLVLMASPAIAPVAGGWLAVTVGWRSIFGLMVAMAAVTLAATLLRLRETVQPGARVDVGALVASYGRLLGRPRFLGYLIGGSCSTTSMYAFLAASPFIFVEMLHRPVQEVGAYYFVTIIGVSVGSLITTRLASRLPAALLIRASSLTALAATLIFLLLALADRLTVLGVLLPMVLFTAAAGVMSPMALTGAVSTDAKAIGAAAGLYGCGQMVVGAICTALTGLGHNPAAAAGLVMAGATALAQLAFTVSLRTPSSPDTPGTA